MGLECVNEGWRQRTDDEIPMPAQIVENALHLRRVRAIKVLHVLLAVARDRARLGRVLAGQVAGGVDLEACDDEPQEELEELAQPEEVDVVRIRRLVKRIMEIHVIGSFDSRREAYEHQQAAQHGCGEALARYVCRRRAICAVDCE